MGSGLVKVGVINVSIAHFIGENNVHKLMIPEHFIHSVGVADVDIIIHRFIDPSNRKNQLTVGFLKPFQRHAIEWAALINGMHNIPTQ